MIYYSIMYSNERRLPGALWHAKHEYIAFRTWSEVNEYFNQLRENYISCAFNEIDPALIDERTVRNFKIYK